MNNIKLPVDNEITDPLNKLDETLNDVQEMVKKTKNTVDRIFDKETFYIFMFFLFSPMLGIFFPIYTSLLIGILSLIVIYIVIFYRDFYKIMGPGSRIFESLPDWVAWYIFYPFVLLIGKPDYFLRKAMTITVDMIMFVINTIFEYPAMFM